MKDPEIATTDAFYRDYGGEREPCPCETHGHCDVYAQLLRGEVNAKEYVDHIKRVVNGWLSAKAVS